MKTKITLELDSEALREVGARAAEEGVSISEFLTAKLNDIVREDKKHARAKIRALARLREGADHGWVRPGSRDELHER